MAEKPIQVLRIEIVRVHLKALSEDLYRQRVYLRFRCGSSAEDVGASTR
jgi:hypothetical protein